MTPLPPLLSASLDALSDPVILIDGRKTIIFFNKAAAGAWPTLVIGMPLSFTLRAPDLVESIDEVLADRSRECEGMFSERDRKSTRLNSSHTDISRMPSSA